MHDDAAAGDGAGDGLDHVGELLQVRYPGMSRKCRSLGHRSVSARETPRAS